jgi:hypothetical protein
MRASSDRLSAGSSISLRRARAWRRASRRFAVAGLLLVGVGLLRAGPVTAAGDEELRTPKDRFEFAPVPEHAFVAGLPETVQLGIWQIDPANPWPAGDQTRSAGWTSRHPTRLVEVASGRPVAGFEYDGRTGELRYAGDGARDVTVRLERADSSVASNPFRLRVLEPTHVYGDGAAAANREHHWGATVCETPMPFAACRKKLKGGRDDGAPLVLHFTPGSYRGDFFLGDRFRFVYVLGDPRNRPQLNGDALAVSRFELATIRNLALNSTRIGSQSYRNDSPVTLLLSNIRQWGETGAQNGVSNPNTATPKPWTVTVWNFEGSGMGDPGNSVHQFYVEGRPLSTFELNNVRILGTRGSSAIKATMRHISIRHSLLSVSETPGDVKSGALMHTPIDVPSVSEVIIYANRFLLYRASTEDNRAGRQGILSAAIYLRQRRVGLRGSDIPAYPNLSWDPPRSSQTSMSSPGEGWSAGPETYVSDEFWKAVRSRPITDPGNPLTFKHFVAFNRFEQLPGSLPVTVLRDDGSHAAEPVHQFGPGRALRVHPAWVERSVTFLAGNTYEGFRKPEPRINLRASEQMVEPQPGAKWPRSKDEEFPHAVTLEGELPAWFKL